MTASSPAPSSVKPVETGASAAHALKAEPQDRINASGPEDDLLDIPAFLRRQAN